MKLRIKEILKEKGQTIQSLSEIINVNRVSLTNSINGNPTIETLDKISTALNVPITELFEPTKTDSINCPKCGTKLIFSSD